MATTTVSSTTALNSALKAAKAGDTILLAPGTYTMSASNLNFASAVTVTSADPMKAAVITGLSVNGSTGLTIRDLEFRADAANGNMPFRVSGSDNVRFVNLDVHGSLDDNPQNDVNAFLVRDSTNITFQDSEFQQLMQGISHLNVDRLTITGNSFHDMRTDGVLGSGSNWVTISGNTFRDFSPKAGDHPDAIQFFTTNTTENVHDIVIKDNVIQRGDGAPFQGIFMRSEVDGLLYERVTISGNLVSGTLYHGISVSDAVNVTVRDNIVQGYVDMKSWIRLDGVQGGSLTGNDANVITLTAATKNVTQSGNVTIPQATDGGAAVYAQWQIEHQQPPSGSGQAQDGGRMLLGGSGADTLTGGDFADTLSGGAGNDLLTGGKGNDLYITDGDARIVETADGGIDTVRSKTSFTMPNHVENLEFVGTAGAWGSGNGLDNVITGNDGSNNLFGRAGNDTLSGGLGNDTLNGGIGNDVLTGGPGADRFVFTKGDGSDVITDFGAGDTLDLSGFYSAGLRPMLVETSGGVTIAFASGDMIVLEDIRLTNLTVTTEGYLF